MDCFTLDPNDSLASSSYHYVDCYEPWISFFLIWFIQDLSTPEQSLEKAHQCARAHHQWNIQKHQAYRTKCTGYVNARIEWKRTLLKTVMDMKGVRWSKDFVSQKSCGWRILSGLGYQRIYATLWTYATPWKMKNLFDMGMDFRFAYFTHHLETRCSFGDRDLTHDVRALLAELMRRALLDHERNRVQGGTRVSVPVPPLTAPEPTRPRRVVLSPPPPARPSPRTPKTRAHWRTRPLEEAGIGESSAGPVIVDDEDEDEPEDNEDDTLPDCIMEDDLTESDDPIMSQENTTKVRSTLKKSVKSLKKSESNPSSDSSTSIRIVRALSFNNHVKLVLLKMSWRKCSWWNQKMPFMRLNREINITKRWY